MNRSLAVILCCQGVLFHATHSAFAADEHPLKDRFEKEARASWTRLKQAFDGWEGKLTQRNIQHFPGREPQDSVRELQYRFRGPLKKVETRDRPDQKTTFISCTNESYAFQLQQNIGEDRLKVIQYAPFKSKEGQRQDFDNVAAYLYAPLRIGGLILPTALEGDALRFDNFQSVRHDGRDMVRVDLQWVPKQMKATARVAAPAERPEWWAIFDPADGWIVYESHMKAPWGESSESHEFMHLESGLPFPSKIHEVSVYQGGKIRVETVWTFDTPQRCEAPAAAFRLSAFGLHEARDWKSSYGSADGRTWLLVNAAVLTLIGAGLFLLRRKRGKSVP
jgi:hypothetical protein